jgi:toxin YhaV
VFAWVNDEHSKRTYESNTDAYRVFKKMLESGNPPNDWNDLMNEATGEIHRLQKITNVEI